MPALISFGELLWDMLPEGPQPGGAPMNVAYHAQRMGAEARVISRVGQDALGDALLALLQDKHINTSLVQRDGEKATSQVAVELDAKGHAHYTIVEDVAWDYIDCTPATLAAVQGAVLVYGSLASRSARSKSSLLACIGAAGLCVFDVNLRPPFFDRDLIEELMRPAHIAKMNEEELDICAAWQGIALPSGDLRAKMEALREAYGLQALLLTQGAEGAYYADAHCFCFQPSFRVRVADTVGSGDAFLGTFLAQHLAKKHPQDALRTACAAGAYVASQHGAMPDYTMEDLRSVGFDPQP